MKWEKPAFVASWILAVIGGGNALLFTLACYMTTTGYIPTKDMMLWVLPWPTLAIVLAVAVHRSLWRSGQRSPFWKMLPVYLVSGIPVLFLLMSWLDHHRP